MTCGHQVTLLFTQQGLAKFVRHKLKFDILGPEAYGIKFEIRIITFMICAGMRTFRFKAV